jgi:hypothetical protein
MRERSDLVVFRDHGFLLAQVLACAVLTAIGVGLWYLLD